MHVIKKFDNKINVINKHMYYSFYNVSKFFTRIMRWLFSSGRLKEGENALRTFCSRAQYKFDKDEVEKMLQAEKDKIEFLNKNSKNILRYVTGFDTVRKNTLIILYFSLNPGQQDAVEFFCLYVLSGSFKT